MFPVGKIFFLHNNIDYVNNFKDTFRLDQFVLKYLKYFLKFSKLIG